LNVIITQAIPLTLLIRRLKAKGVLNQPCHCSAQVGSDTLVVRWQGPLTHAKARPLYEHFTSALKQKLQLELDLSDCTYVGTDVIPHIAAVELSQKLALRKFSVSSASPSVVSIFKLASAPFAVGVVNSAS
jgi:anti-anti-sigma regulatory factor